MATEPGSPRRGVAQAVRVDFSTFNEEYRNAVESTLSSFPDSLSAEDMDLISVEDIRVPTVFEKVEARIQQALDSGEGFCDGYSGSPPDSRTTSLGGNSAQSYAAVTASPSKLGVDAPSSPGSQAKPREDAAMTTPALVRSTQSWVESNVTNATRGTSSTAIAANTRREQVKRRIGRNNYIARPVGIAGPHSGSASLSLGPTQATEASGGVAEPGGSSATQDQETGKSSAWMSPSIPPEELIVSIEFFNKRQATKFQEFRALGSQTLACLKDKLYCVTDHILDGPETPSGFFLIGNTFYSDMRSEKCIDYSEGIRAWLGKQDRAKALGLEGACMKKMEDTPIRDLKVDLNQHYLYVHQGNCRHSIVFTDVRIPHADDIEPSSSYPLMVFQGKIRRRKCRACQSRAARFVTYFDKLAEESPCFFCEECYRDLHYGADDQLLYDDFDVYPYYHDQP